MIFVSYFDGIFVLFCNLPLRICFGHSAGCRRGFGHLTNPWKEMRTLFSSIHSEISLSNFSQGKNFNFQKLASIRLGDITIRYIWNLRSVEFSLFENMLEKKHLNKITLYTWAFAVDHSRRSQKMLSSHIWLVRLLISGNWES